MMKLSDYVIGFVADQGVKHVFFLPGGGAMHLNESLGQCSAIEPICNLHEQASAIAAEAYAKVTGGLGVALVTSGPGGTNAVTGVAAAFLDSTPCLFLSGQVKSADLKGDTGVRQMGNQEIDIVSIVQAVTKYAVTVTDPSRIRYHLEKALYLATSGRQGPVWIDIPMDVQAASIEPAELDSFQPPAVARNPDLAGQVARAIELLNQADRPVLIAGHGVHRAQAQQLFAQAVAALGIPILTTWLGMDLMPDCHPLAMGRPGAIAPRGANFTLQNADLLIVLGARLDAATTGYSHSNLARAARKIMIDIDPAEMTKMKTPIDLPICSDAADFLREVLRQHGDIAPKSRGSWIALCNDWKSRYPVVLPEHRAQTDPLSMYHFSETLSEQLEEGDVVASGSSGFGCEIFLLVLNVKPKQRIFHARGLGAMGFGLPAAIGACLANQRRRVVCIDGDGGFQMNIQELETVARHRLPIKFFVVNNDGYASIRSSQANYFKHLVGADATSGLTLPDLGKLAAAFGISFVRLNGAAGLREQIGEALRADGPVICEAPVLRDEARMPRLASVQKPDGSMASRPLEDLWPFLDRQELRRNMLIPTVEE